MRKVESRLSLDTGHAVCLIPSVVCVLPTLIDARQAATQISESDSNKNQFYSTQKTATLFRFRKQKVLSLSLAGNHALRQTQFASVALIGFHLPSKFALAFKVSGKTEQDSNGGDFKSKFDKQN